MLCILLNCTRGQLEDEKFKSTPLGEEWWYYVNKFGAKVPYVGHTIGDTSNLVKPTPRLFLQLLGTEGMRDVLHPNVHVNSLMSGYRPVGSFVVMDFGNSTDQKPEEHIVYPDWIITDVRFKNEADIIKDKGGILIRVNRSTGYTDYHPSEIALDDYQDWDYVIHNSGTFEELVNEVKDIYNKI
jgi:hypothetical protein